MPMLALRCGAVLKRKRRVAFESHCFRPAHLQLDPAIAGVCRDRTGRRRKGKGQLTICPYPEVVSSTGSADGWQSVSEMSGSVSCACRCRRERGFSATRLRGCADV